MIYDPEEARRESFWSVATASEGHSSPAYQSVNYCGGASTNSQTRRGDMGNVCLQDDSWWYGNIFSGLVHNLGYDESTPQDSILIG